jgi:hypothetical protein
MYCTSLKFSLHYLACTEMRLPISRTLALSTQASECSWKPATWKFASLFAPRCRPWSQQTVCASIRNGATAVSRKGSILLALSHPFIGNTCTAALSSCTSCAMCRPITVIPPTVGSAGACFCATPARAHVFARKRVPEDLRRLRMLSAVPMGEESGEGRERCAKPMGVESGEGRERCSECYQMGWDTGRVQA